MNLSKNIEVVRVQNAAAAGTSDLDGTVVDMQGYDGVLFIYGVGALTATQVTKLVAKQDVASGGAFTALTGADSGAMADGDGNKLLMLDVFRPTKRYVRPTLDRGTANAVVDFGIAILYRGSKAPVTQGTTVAKAVLAVSPAESA